MTHTDQTVVAVNDSLDLSNLIERTLSHQIEVVKAAIASDDPDASKRQSANVVCSFDDNIALNVRISDSSFSPINISTNKVTGFWSDSVVTGHLSLERFQGKAELKASVSSSSGGTELKDGLTEAQAYIHKGRAIQIVAEALSLAENNLGMAENLKTFLSACAELRDLESKHIRKQRDALADAYQETLANDPDLIEVTDTDALLAAMKSVVLDEDVGSKIILAFNNGRPTEKEGVEALKAVAMFNDSTLKRQMTAQFIGRCEFVQDMKGQPSGSSRKLEKVTQKDLAFILRTEPKFFVSRSQSDPKLVALIEKA